MIEVLHAAKGLLAAVQRSGYRDHVHKGEREDCEVCVWVSKLKARMVETECSLCDGEGWVWRTELPLECDPYGRQSESDDTRYQCPQCEGLGLHDTPA